MGISHADYLAMQSRLSAACRASASKNQPSDVEVGARGFHNRVLEWCDKQRPRWKAIHSRTDRASTTEPGIADFIIFGPDKFCIVAEAKSKTGKQTEAQLIWSFEMGLLGWKVHIIRSFEDFLDVVQSEKSARNPLQRISEQLT